MIGNLIPGGAASGPGGGGFAWMVYEELEQLDDALEIATRLTESSTAD